MRLVIEQIEKSYGSVRALSNFSVNLEPGVYALLGPNGSGKSTLMNIIANNLLADRGTITFCDMQTGSTIHSTDTAYLEKIGYMPQYPGLYRNFTAVNFLFYMAYLKGIDPNVAKQQVAELLSVLDLKSVCNQKIRTLSGGMRQRLTLAQAILGNPSVLVLDEPTAGLDPQQRIAVRNYISKIAQNKIILIATHVVSDIEYIAKEIILLKKGVIADKAPAEELTKKMDGKVWNALCKESDVLTMQMNFHVVNITRDDKTNNVVLRIISDEQPTENSKNILPTLEDYYLYIFGEAVNRDER